MTLASRAMLGAAALVLASCAAPAPPPAAPAVQGTIPPSDPRPIVATSDDGLELHWWLADDTGGRVGHVLAGLAEPAIPEGSVAGERLRSAGLRLMRARRADLATLERELPPTRTRRREWLGWFSRWTEIFRGRRAGGGAPLLVAGRRESFDAGTLRLIARAWPAPGLERHASPRVRLDLAVQLVPDPKPLTETIFEQPRAIDPAHAGHVFGETALELTLEDGLIYILTSAPPSASWDVGDEPASDPRPELPPGPPSPGVDFRSFGPPASTARSVGEAMFSATSEETGSADLNVVLVLLPRAPDRFRILPGEAPAAR